MYHRRKILLFAVGLGLVVTVPSCMLLREHSARVAHRDLAAIVPQIISITLYDLHINDSHDSTALGGAISAPFPADVFTRAATSAQHRSGTTIWKGSSLAILTLRDGTQRRAHFSYYGSFFTLEGISGRFVVPTSTGFQDTFIRFIQERFVPQRRQRNTRNA